MPGYLNSKLLAVAMVALLPACSGTVFKKFEIGPEASSLSVDATQRFLLVKKMPEDSFIDVMVCAEPSPDAARTVAAQIAGAGVLPNGLQARLSGQRSEALASLATRTTSIQLVRDLWYRACEGAMNGLHGPEQINEYAKHVGKLIAALAAYDAIAGSPASPAVAIGQNTNASVADSGSDGAAGDPSGNVDVVNEFADGAIPGRLSDEAAKSILEIYRTYVQATSLPDQDAQDPE